MLSMFVTIMVLWGAFGVFETGCMYFTDGADGNGSTGNSGGGGFNSAGGGNGPNNDGAFSLPIIQQSDDQQKLFEQKEYCFGEQTVKVEKKYTVASDNSVVLPPFMDWYCKILNSCDRPYHHNNKIVFQPLSVSTLHENAIDNLQNNTLKGQMNQNAIEDIIYNDILQNCNSVLEDPVLSVLFGDEALRIKLELFAGNYANIMKSFIYISKYSLNNLQLPFCISHPEIVSHGTLVVTDSSQMCPLKAKLHNHPVSRSNAVFFDEDSGKPVWLSFKQCYSSSSFGGENTKLNMSTNISGQNKPQYVTPVMITSSTTTQDSSVVVVKNRALYRFLSEDPRNNEMLRKVLQVNVSKGLQAGNKQSVKLLLTLIK